MDKDTYFQIETLKIKLKKTDYLALKYAEGHLSESEYAPIKQQRQAWRDEINRLEGGTNGTNQINTSIGS